MLASHLLADDLAQLGVVSDEAEEPKLVAAVLYQREAWRECNISQK